MPFALLHRGMRLLLAEGAKVNTGHSLDQEYDVGDVGEDDHGGHKAPFTFEELLSLVGILWCVFVVGKMCAKHLGLPELIGQILAGIALGPHGLELAPKHEALMLIGELGLVLMVLEAGIEVELAQLSVVGLRGVVVAFVGSLLPLAIGTALSAGIFGLEIRSALAVGASLAPTSMGISLKVLEEGKVLSTPTGQLIIAAAVIDDVIALVLLAQLEALENPTPINFVIPIVSSLGFIFVLGFAAIRVVPGFLANWVVPRLPQMHIEASLLGMVLASGSVLMAVVHYGRSSHLLGAFLGGLMFCTLPSVKSVWHHKVANHLQWLVRIFFSCSIAFEVPIRDLWTGPILKRAAVFLLVAFGKLATGGFAKPYTHRKAFTIGFAMAAWGEFAFIVATASREMGTLDSDTYGAVVLAVLLSAVYSPLAVEMAVAGGESESKSKTGGTPTNKAPAPLDENGNPMHHVYYLMSLQTKSKWGLTDKLMHCVHGALDVDIVDFRIHTIGAQTLFELYLRDHELWAPNNHEDCEASEAIEKRCDDCKKILGKQFCLDSDDMVFVDRWVPDLGDNPDHDDSKAFAAAQQAFNEEYPEEAKQKWGGHHHSLHVNPIADIAETEDMSVSGRKLRADDVLRASIAQDRARIVNRQRRRTLDGIVDAPQLFARRETLLRRRVPRLSESAATTQHHLALRRTFVVGDGDDKEVVQGPAAATLTLSGAAGNMLQAEVMKHIASQRRLSDVIPDEDDTPTELSPKASAAERKEVRLSVMTISGAAGDSLAEEVRRQLANDI